MFKRVRWVAIGFGAGIGASVYVYKTVRTTVDKHTTPELRDAGRKANAFRRDVQAAVSEGRTAMHEREAELNAQIAGGQPDRGQIAGGPISNGRPVNQP
jgi:phage tail tape-measure protein